MAATNNEPRSTKSAQSTSPQEPASDVAREIDRVSRDDVLTGPAGAAVRAMLISAVIMGGAMWLARLFLRRDRPESRKRNG